MRVAFVGAVEGSLVALESLVRNGTTPELVLTLPAHAAARHSDFVDLSPLASASGSEVITATDVNAPEVVEALDRFRPDLLLIMGWSQICRAPVRATARIGCVGFHPAPLPRMRGRAVIPWTILQNEKATAATLFWLDEGVDSGPILLQERIDVSPDETARSLYRKQTQALARMLPRAVELVRSGKPPASGSGPLAGDLLRKADAGGWLDRLAGTGGEYPPAYPRGWRALPRRLHLQPGHQTHP